MAPSIDWQLQASQPLFSDLLWSRPEKKSLRGKLVVIGGTTHDLFAPLTASQEALTAGIGELRTLLPETAPAVLWQNSNLERFPVTQGGGIAARAIEMVDAACHWADGLLLPGSLGKASETVQLIGQLLRSQKDQLIVFCGDSVDAAIENSDVLLGRSAVVLVANLSQLQHLAKSIHSTEVLSSQLPLRVFGERCGTLAAASSQAIITTYGDHLIVACQNRLSATQRASTATVASDKELISVAAVAAVIGVQFPAQLFKALTTAAWISSESNTEGK